MGEVGLTGQQTNGAATTTAAKKKPRGTVTRNRSVVAIAKISAVLDALETDEERSGVLQFIGTQYGA
jgi:hypothetical protein